MPLPVDFVPLFMAILVVTSPVNADPFLINGVTAHRGNSGESPENTIAAFNSGIEVGADWLELDIFKSRDGKLVVIHDRTTERVGDKDLDVVGSTYEDLLVVDVATKFRRTRNLTIEQCPRQSAPLLKDVLLLVMSQNRTRVSIQPKMDCVAEAVALVRQLKCESWVGFNDGDLALMAKVKRLAPELPVFWDRGESNIDQDIAIAKQHGFESLVLNQKAITKAKIDKIHRAGLEVGAWTVNEKAAMKRLLTLGIDRIYTD
jgi:glycerophosphoryl diester phosphodiesterase